MEYTFLLLPLLVALARGHGERAQEESGEEEKIGTGYIYQYNSGYEKEHANEEQVGQLQEHEHVKTVTVTKEVPALYPVFNRVHYPVKEYFEKAPAYRVQKPVPVHVRAPVKVPYPLQIPKLYPVTVEKKVPYPVHVRVPVFVPVKVPVEKKVFIPVFSSETETCSLSCPLCGEGAGSVHLKEPYPLTMEKKVPIVVKVPKGKPYPVRAPVPIKDEEWEEGFEEERLPGGLGGKDNDLVVTDNSAGTRYFPIPGPVE